MKLGVFTGSFNPVHNGHMKIVDYLLAKNYVDKIIIIPTKNYWTKQNLKPLKDRLNMLKFYEDKNIIISDKYSNYQYTYQILRKLKKDYKANLFLIIGSDNLINLNKWKNIDEILLNKIIVLNRNNIDIKKYLRDFDINRFIVIYDFNYIDISSTDIRNGSRNYLKQEVYDYIESNGLYQSHLQKQSLFNKNI